MSFTVCSSGAMVIHAGENVDTTASTSGAILQQLSDEGEAYLSVLVKYNIVTNWASLNAVYRNIFSDWAARNGAVALIQYNLLGDGGNTKSRISSEDQINIHVYRMRKIERLLEGKGITDFLGVNS